VNIAIVGCGAIGRAHARGYAAIEGVRVTHVVDPDDAAAGSLAAEIDGAECLSDLDGMPESVDLVSLTTPPATHYALAGRILERGMPLFCEKPLAMTANEARELIGLARRTNTPLSVGFKMRYEPVFRRARELMDRLKDVRAVTTTKVQPYRPKPRYDWIPGVGAMFELSVHDFDLACWIGGLRPTSVYADLRRQRGWEREDQFFLAVDFSGGEKGMFAGMYASDASFVYRDLTMTFLAENGYMRIERPDRIVLHLEEFTVESVDPAANNAFVEELAAFTHCVAGKHPPEIEPEAGFYTTALVEAANLSSRTGTAIPVPALSADG
jgi:myo-inositol 2-dehydrogenase/D-chiro-inositol 1-dehydrogenase